MRVVDGSAGMVRRVRATRAAVMAMTMCLALAAGCVRGGNEPETAAEPVPPTRLRVENQAFLDMTIYVYRSSQRIRLGLATGSAVTMFTIPSYLMFGSTPLRFQADPIGANRSPVSQEITVSPGDEVVLMIPPS